MSHRAPANAVVDAKYKAEKPSGYPNADVYQMLAYCLRLGLPIGHLVYAKGESSPGHHDIVGTDVSIVRHALELDASPSEVLEQIRLLPGEVVTTSRHEPTDGAGGPVRHALGQTGLRSVP